MIRRNTPVGTPVKWGGRDGEPEGRGVTASPVSEYGTVSIQPEGPGDLISDENAVENLEYDDCPPGQVDTEKAQELLEAAREAQAAFWHALGELEQCIGVDVDDNRDLTEVEIEDLIEEDEDK